MTSLEQDSTHFYLLFVMVSILCQIKLNLIPGLVEDLDRFTYLSL